MSSDEDRGRTLKVAWGQPCHQSCASLAVCDVICHPNALPTVPITLSPLITSCPVAELYSFPIMVNESVQHVKDPWWSTPRDAAPKAQFPCLSSYIPQLPSWNPCDPLGAHIYATFPMNCPGFDEKGQCMLGARKHNMYPPA